MLNLQKDRMSRVPLTLVIDPTQLEGTVQIPGQASRPTIFPLPLTEYTTDQLGHIENWWKLQTVYYQYLLHLHPDHTLNIPPERMDPQLLKGPAADVALIFRSLVLAFR